MKSKKNTQNGTEIRMEDKPSQSVSNKDVIQDVPTTTTPELIEADNGAKNSLKSRLKHGAVIIFNNTVYTHKNLTEEIAVEILKSDPSQSVKFE